MAAERRNENGRAYGQTEACSGGIVHKPDPLRRHHACFLGSGKKERRREQLKHRADRKDREHC